MTSHAPADRSHTQFATMSLGEHLEDLRRRLLFGLLGIIPILAATLWFGKSILEFLLRPAIKIIYGKHISGSFQVTSFFEGFNTYMKLSLVISVIVGGPWLLYQLWRFIAPGLYVHERRFIYILAPLSLLLSISSLFFMYLVMLPVVLEFFVLWNASFQLPISQINRPEPLPPGIVLPAAPVLKADPLDPQPGNYWFNSTLMQLRVCLPDTPGDDQTTHATPSINASAFSANPDSQSALIKLPVTIRGIGLTGSELISQQYRISEYVSMILGFSIAFGVGFQMPVAVLILGWAGLVSPTLLSKYRRHAILTCAILGAVLTPADPISMLVLAIPLYLLYELGVILLRLLPIQRVLGNNHTPPGESQNEPPDFECHDK